MEGTDTNSLPAFITVVFVPENTCLSIHDVREIIERYRSDDVFRDEFLSGVLLTAVNCTAQIEPDAEGFLRSLGTRWFGKRSAASLERLPSPGPWYISGNELFEVLRLYDDDSSAFIHAFTTNLEWYALIAK